MREAESFADRDANAGASASASAEQQADRLSSVEQQGVLIEQEKKIVKK